MKNISTNDYRTYFGYLDGIANYNEVAYTLFDKYVCTANCELCYIKEELKEAKETAMISDPSKITEDIEYLDQIFNKITFVDDLYLLKNTYPEHYNFMRDNSSKICFGGMTDNQWFKIQDLLLEFNFKEIDELSLSERFLDIHKDKLLDILSKLADKYKINRLKIISNSVNGCPSSLYEPMARYVNSVDVMNEFKESDSYEVPSEVLNHSMYYSNSILSIDIMKTIIVNKEDLVYSLLKAKLDYYKISQKNQYQRDVSSSLVLDKNYNVIPGFMFIDAEKLKSYIISHGIKGENVTKIINNDTLVALKIESENESVRPLYSWEG